MDILIRHILPHIHQQHLGVLSSPAQHLAKDLHRDTLHPLKVIRHLHGAQNLLVPPLRPRRRRYREPLLRNIMEPRVRHVPRVLKGRERVPPGLADPLEEVIVPPPQRRALERPVHGLEVDDGLLELDLAARVEVLVDLPKEFRKVKDGGAHIPAVDVVEFLAKRPLVLGVVDFEMAVCRHVFRLDGAQVRAEDLRCRVPVGELDGPDAGACADVEDAVGVGDGGEAELVVEDAQGDGVLEV
ncbi:hypothetical protein CCUS01_12223 [Colletotrichum cuscutae]|uniref:Uncharacterized protein n=1 Tax=Colletotrichum cuscutae TaxID=1209917 RepID=A0AAI9TXY4_9PEZI|nr:hypothetical protein CCUS01_12223 [Colletotrichum cuscutae]